MNIDLANVDPAWAWSRYQPDAERPWNLARAAHLFRRAGFGATGSELDRALGQPPEKVVAQLLQPGDKAVQFQRQMETFGQAVLASGNAEALTPWWLYRMRHSPDPLLEKLTLFWHGHFATSAAKVSDARLMYRQHMLLRWHARGKFGPLVHAISRDPAMLLYLDSATNRKNYPNENYARELMELFCLGTGNYTEQDIQELARAFTGWEVQRGKFRFNEYEHDRGRKTILGRAGNFGGDEGVRIVLAQPAAARFIAGKLFRFFVCDEPAPPAALVEPLARALRESDFDIARVVGTILGSELFFSEYAIGRKVRSPVELGIGLLRWLEASTNMNKLSERLAELGQRPFYPPNVKGWDGGRTWINSSTLLGRANLVRDIVAQADVGKLAAGGSVDSPAEIVDWALASLVAVPVPSEVRDSLAQFAMTKPDGAQRIAKTIHAIGTLPEFQLS